MPTSPARATTLSLAISAHFWRCGSRYAGEDIRPLKVLSLAPIKETVGTRGDDDVKTHIRRYFEAAPTNAPATAGAWGAWTRWGMRAHGWCGSHLCCVCCVRFAARA